ncbi:hypothetical protein GGD81_004204 [Rhodobium orientis]|nr:hypothetical protein [Rhodobium orientis]MBB4305136.1 hypothetical protein [Rhodobium orientis]
MSEQAKKSDRTETISETDLANERMGNNQLQGNDQESVRNQRHSQPDVKTETDGVIESFEKLDKETRARRDLGKGNRKSDADS